MYIFYGMYKSKIMPIIKKLLIMIQIKRYYAQYLSCAIVHGEAIFIKVLLFVYKVELKMNKS